MRDPEPCRMKHTEEQTGCVYTSSFINETEKTFKVIRFGVY